MIHGFNKNSKDMKPLERNLELLGYQCLLPDLPLTYKELEYGVSALEANLEKIIQNKLHTDEKIHLVGHSTGGLVIRKLISERKYSHKIGRCVLIASPNNGSKLADIAGKIKLFVNFFRTLKSLSYTYIEQLNLTNPSNIEIAAIAGSRNNLLLGNLIDEKNDGRVEVSSVYYPELNDFLTLPYGHKEIHHKIETAKWVDVFLRTGKFK